MRTGRTAAHRTASGKAALRPTTVWLAHLALVLAALYAAAVAAMFLAQSWLLFPTGLAAAARVQLPA